MRNIENRIFILIIAILSILVFSPPSQTQAARSAVEPDQFSCANVSEIPQIECEALVAIYNSTDGPSWAVDTEWLVTSTPCNWSGVVCGEGSVEALHLENFGSRELKGALPAAIGNLSNLVWLNLSYNQLNSLPNEIGNLDKLRTLELDYNQLSSLPPGIGDLDRIEVLILEYNQLSSLPNEIGDLDNLGRLLLQHNQLNSLPPGIGNFENLGRLELDYNQLSNLPPEIGNLSNLTRLELQGNQLSNLPPEIGNLSNLTRLRLHENQLSSLPFEIGNLSNLTALDLGRNQLNSLPPTIGNLSNLTSLSLIGNHLNNLPVEIGNLNQLREIGLDSNQLSNLPAELGNLSTIEYMNVAYNRLTIADTNLYNFLQRVDSDWETTQTLAPTNIAAIDTADGRMGLMWAPIAFQDKGGYYEISVAIEGGTFNVHGTTASKSETNYTFEGLVSGATYTARIRTYTPPHDGEYSGSDDSWDDQPNELWSDYSTPVSFTVFEPTPTPTNTPTPTFTPTVTNTPTATPVFDDDYEPDDNCTDAISIQPDSVWQSHNFHKPDDIDWATFTAPAVSMYRIEATIPDSSRADVELYYYTACASAVEDQFVEAFTPGARLDVQADSAGQQFYIELRNVDDRKFGLDVNYNLSVRQLSSQSNEDSNSLTPGPAVIVAGRYREDDSAQDNINQVAINAYRLFKAEGRSDSDIYFLGTDPLLPGYDAMATQSNLQEAITEWARDLLQQEETSKTLTLYLVDHGNQDQLYLDNMEQEILVPNDLDAWLTTVENEISELQVNVIIEASQAGSFIDSANGTISKNGRVIITSSNKEQDANLSPHGAIFSDNFITNLSQEYNLDYSFSESARTVQALHSNQEPWIDANGNSEPNEPNDLIVASARGFMGPNSSDSEWPPYIATVQLAERISGIQIEVRHRGNTSDIEEVWAVVYPPDYMQPTGTAVIDGELNEEALDVIEFEVSDEALFVEVEAYLGFTETGIYQVAIHARDANGLVAQPVIITVDTHHWLYLPVVSR